MTTNHFILLAFGLSLAACSSTNRQAPVVDTSVQPIPQPQGLTDADIRNALAGKTWRWTGPKNSGVTVYAANGTSLVEVTGKGTASGTWVVEGGSLCETLAPTKFFPKGMPKSCQRVSGNVSRLIIGQATFTPG